MPEQALQPQEAPPHIDVPALEQQIAQLIVQGLNLPMTAAQIDPEAPLYGAGLGGAGLGLDSIDILEIALLVSKQYGIQLRADDQENEQVFRSLRHFARYVAEQRTK